MSIFKTQSLFSITAKTHYDDLGSAEVIRILYKKPGGTAGYWDASAVGTNIVYNVSNGDIDVIGQWTFQAYVEVGGLKGYGEEFTTQIKKPIL